MKDLNKFFFLNELSGGGYFFKKLVQCIDKVEVEYWKEF